MAVENSILKESTKHIHPNHEWDIETENKSSIGEGFKRVDDQSYILHLFRNVSKEKELTVLTDFGFFKTYALMYLHNYRDDILYLKFDKVDAEISTFGNDNIKVAFNFKEEFIIFDSKILQINNLEYIIQKPETILSSLRRLISRYKFNNDELAEMQFPIENTQYRLLDISTKGLSFLSNKPINPDSIFSNINIQLENEVVIWIDGCVKYCKFIRTGYYICGLAFLDKNWATFDKIFKYIFKRNYPNLKPLLDFDMDKIYYLFSESGYLDLKTKEEMNCNFKEMADTCSLINSRSQISMNVAYVHEEKLFSTASLLRIYNRTFLGHQLAAIPESRMNLKTKTDVYLSLTDFLLNHPYCKYYLTYFNANSLWHNQMYKKINSYIDSEEKSLFDSIQLFEYEVEKAIGFKSKYSCQQLINHDQFLEFCNSQMGGLEKNSYSYNEDFQLEEIKQVYELVGLHMDRKLWGVFNNNKIVAFIVTEIFTRGLNLYDLLDMARLYIVNEEAMLDDIMKAALPSIESFYKRYNRKRFNILIKIQDEVAVNLNIPGLIYSHRMGRFFMSIKGLSAYKKFFMLNT